MRKSIFILFLFALFLPILSQDTLSVSRIESEDKKNIPEKFRSALNIVDDGKSLPVPAFKAGTACLKGQIHGYKASEYAAKMSLRTNPLFETREESYSSNIAEDGSFECIIPLISDVTVLFNGPWLDGSIVLSPGEVSEVFIDLELKEARSDGGQFAFFSGANAELNNQFFSSEYQQFLDKKHAILEQIEEYPSEGIIAYSDSLHAFERNVLKEISKTGFTLKMKELLSLQVKYEVFLYLIFTNDNLESIYESLVEDATSDSETIEYREMVEQYYKLVKDIPFNEPKSLYVFSYPLLIAPAANMGVGENMEVAELEVFKKLTGTNEGLFYDLYKLRKIAYDYFENMEPISNKLLEEIKAMDIPAFYTYFKYRNNSMKISRGDELILIEKANVRDVIDFEKRINPEVEFLDQDIRLRKSFYPLFDKYKTTDRPIVTYREAQFYLPLYTEYFFTPHDSIVRLVLYNWEKDRFGNYYKKKELWEEEKNRFEEYDKEYNRIKGVIDILLGQSVTHDIGAKRDKTSKSGSLTRSTIWETEDYYASLNMIFGGITYRIRFKFYYKD